MSKVDYILNELKKNLPNACIELELVQDGSVNFLIFFNSLIQEEYYRLKKEKIFIGSLSEKEAEIYLNHLKSNIKEHPLGEVGLNNCYNNLRKIDIDPEDLNKIT